MWPGLTRVISLLEESISLQRELIAILSGRAAVTPRGVVTSPRASPPKQYTEKDVHRVGELESHDARIAESATTPTANERPASEADRLHWMTPSNPSI